MDFSKLNHRIVLQARLTSRDAIGGQSLAWAQFATVWAKISELSGRELFAAQADHSQVTHEITIRYQRALAVPSQVAAMRIVYKGRHFNIHSSANLEERNEWIVLRASEGLNDG